MDTSQLNTISGEYREGEPATVRFYGRITEESAARFNEEFDCAESVRPSLIRVLINSEGGSVSFGAVGVGAEARWGKCSYKKFGGSGDEPEAPEKPRLKTGSVRVFLSFRF